MKFFSACRLAASALAAGTLVLAACSGGSVNAPDISKAAHFDAQSGDVILLKSSADTDSLGQPLVTDVPKDTLMAMDVNGSLRVLKVTDPSGNRFQPTTVVYEDVDSQVGLLRLDTGIFAFRKNDGALLRLGYYPAAGMSPNLLKAVGAGATIYAASQSGLVSYSKATLLSASAGSVITPTVLFTPQGYSFYSGIIDEAAGVALLDGHGIVTLAGVPVRVASEYYDLAGSAVYTSSVASFVQCPGGPGVDASTLSVIQGSASGALLTPLLVTKPSSDVTCNPETNGVQALFASNGKAFEWDQPDYPRAGNASYAFEVVGSQVISHPNLAAAMNAAFPNYSFWGGLHFDCTQSECMFALLDPGRTLAAFSTDDANFRFKKDTAPPVAPVAMHALPISGDFLIVGDKAVTRAKLQGNSLVYTPKVTINGTYVAVPVN